MNKAIFLISLGIFIIIGVFYAFNGIVNVDEGFYLLSSNLVYQGKLPYRDFFFNQMPVYPYIAGFFQRVIKPDFYLARIISLFFGFLSFFMALKTAEVKDQNAKAIAAILIGLNPFVIYYFTICKLYSLTSLFIMATAYFLVRGNLNRPLVRFFVALFGALSACTRLTAFALFPGILFITFGKARLLAMLELLIYYLILMSLIFLPFYFLSRDTIYYQISTYLVEKDVIPSVRQLLYRLDTLLNLIRHYFPALLIFLLIIGYGLFDKLNREKSSPKFIHDFAFKTYKEDPLWLIASLVFLAHLFAKKPSIDRYLTIIFPIFATACAISLSRIVTSFKNEEAKDIFILILFILGIFHAIAVVAEFLKVESIGAKPKMIYHMAEVLKKNTDIKSPIMTFNNSVAVISGRKVLPGYEMNTLSFDEEWFGERAKRMNILDLPTFYTIIEEKQLGAILITKNTFTHNFPRFYRLPEKQTKEVMSKISQRYQLVQLFSEAGYFGEEAMLFLPKKD